MNSKLFAVVWIDAVIAFFIPFGSTLAAALGPFVAAGSAGPTHVGWLVMGMGAGIAGASGLKSFLSTTVSDAKDDLATPPIPHAPLPVDAQPPKA